MKTCKCCGDIEWPCFLVDALCRMCQARRRDARRVNKETDNRVAKETDKELFR
jgi:hypothetical protein